ncbi:glycoside hydrolase family 3 N-terminal domain-containing protein [Marivivens sp. LCG002]|uniref:glycoside hydrolase family 3 N-terminal domain-containing protein n=1 Tax=Marivivens sp. LCG002 TaxID=3051171 RepID=UPI0025575D3A|nr:glycoside hydrolase family 3 N-terminal domain-containing protein [Marivivens sp. LCG002]WIV52056.1 glycoside hydrolase family 3 N-terminal domain-containing protein [Marivivens sp. LCG002]
MFAAEEYQSEADAIETGKVIIAGFRGTKPGDPEVERVCEMLASGNLAGVLLLARNIKSPEQLLELTSRLKEAAADLSPVIAIDQEGGKVARLGPENGFLKWGSASEISGSEMTEDDMLDYFTARARELSLVGINVNFGPVVDLNLNPDNPIIGKLGRSFGDDPELVTRIAKIIVAAHRNANVATCLKHFPGHGSSVSDSHMGVTNVSETWRSDELEPYLQMIADGYVDAIMSSHIINDKLALRPNVPFSLSPALSSVLRGDLKYVGPVFSDDMQMGAITQGYGLSEAARLAINAGNTFLVYSNFRSEYDLDSVENVRSAIEVELALGGLDGRQLQAQIALANSFRMKLS